LGHCGHKSLFLWSTLRSFWANRLKVGIFKPPGCWESLLSQPQLLASSGTFWRRPGNKNKTGCLRLRDALRIISISKDVDFPTNPHDGVTHRRVKGSHKSCTLRQHQVLASGEPGHSTRNVLVLLLRS
jgi:hypothetical protein